ncbi:MAG TPA: DUF4439 domain-containing protein [Mycobacteriales bacterium]|nr:DUF4439 domain-containing protein [Mycobacteriales bacterium]
MISRRTMLAAPIVVVGGSLVTSSAAQSSAAQSSATQSPAVLTGLEAALALEHEAVHTVPAVGARLGDAPKELAREIDAHHRVQRDRLDAALRAARRTPPAALPAYALPHAVVDRASAFDVLLVIEEALMRAYADAVESEPAIHQRLAAELLARCATHVTSLRIAESRSLFDATQPFPSRGD